MTAAITNQQALFFTRTFEAPIDVLFELFTQPRHIIQWFGPRTVSLTQCEVDLRVGGKWRVCLRGPDGDVWVWGTYRAIDPPGMLSFSYSMDLMRCETLVNIRFEPAGPDATRIHFHQADFPTEDDRRSHSDGWNSAFDKLAEHILRFKGAGLLRPGLFPPGQRDGVAADFEAAAARAEAERKAGVRWQSTQD